MAREKHFSAQRHDNRVAKESKNGCWGMGQEIAKQCFAARGVPKCFRLFIWTNRPVEEVTTYNITESIWVAT